MDDKQRNLHIIDSVKIEGFWGNKTLEFNLHDDVNFLIGENGSGKTTVINLVVAVLNVRIRELINLEFSEILIKLKSIEDKKKPTIRILKRDSIITYGLREKSRIKESYVHFRNRPSDSIRIENMIETIQKFIKISWLSVHRAKIKRYDFRERVLHSSRNFPSSVDTKLKELSNRLIRHFSSLNSQNDELHNEFLQILVLSLLYNKESEDLNWNFSEKLDITKREKVFKEIFTQFGVSQKKINIVLKSHFSALNNTMEKMIKEKELKLNGNDFEVLIGTRRVDYIAAEWMKIVKKRKDIFQYRDRYLKILNDMLSNKRVEINEENELEITSTTDPKKELNINELSSGEKQLLIILGEALLQENKSWIYIADEPELSLHIEWQEQLVRNLRAINPNSQILFATHSPDIVSDNGDNIFDMEEILE